MKGNAGFEPLLQVIVVRCGSVDGGIALPLGGGVAARLLFRVGPDLVRGLACHADMASFRKN